VTEFLISKEQLRALGGPVLAPSEPGGPARPGGRRAYSGRWVADDGETEVGKAFDLKVPAVRAEAFLPSGAIEHVELESDLSFEGEPPAEAAELRVLEGERVLAQIPLLAARAPPRMPEVTPIRVGPQSASFVYPIFSERFSSEQAFLDAVGSLYEWIRNVAPFDRDDVQAGFGIDAYFWPSGGAGGHFGTQDISYDCANPPPSAVTFLGNNEVAKSRIGHLMLDGKFGLVLINSEVRGGAGGVPEWKYPAWASITACPGETWQAVALHEIGHGLGLADEYRDSGRAGEQPENEPNVAATQDFANLMWRSLLTEVPATASSFFSLERQNLIRAGQAPVPARDFVGLFQGARYRSDLYRPSWQCLMLSTAVTQFCPVCARSIVTRITQ